MCRAAAPPASAISSAPRQMPSSGTSSLERLREEALLGRQPWVAVLLMRMGRATEGQDRVVASRRHGCVWLLGGQPAVDVRLSAPRAHRRRPRDRRPRRGRSPRRASGGDDTTKHPLGASCSLRAQCHKKFTPTACNWPRRRLPWPQVVKPPEVFSMNNCSDHKLNVNVPAGIVRGAACCCARADDGSRRVHRWSPCCEVEALKPAQDKPNQQGRTPSGPPFFVALMGPRRRCIEHAHADQQGPMS